MDENSVVKGVDILVNAINVSAPRVLCVVDSIDHKTKVIENLKSRFKPYEKSVVHTFKNVYLCHDTQILFIISIAFDLNAIGQYQLLINFKDM